MSDRQWRARGKDGGVARRYGTDEHLKDEDSERVPIDTLVVRLGLNDLGCEVVGRSTERPGHVRNVLCEPKVGHLDVSVRAEQNVFRLKITVDDVERVQVVERESDLRGVKLGDRVGETL